MQVFVFAQNQNTKLKTNITATCMQTLVRYTGVSVFNIFNTAIPQMFERKTGEGQISSCNEHPSQSHIY